jgi:hypothetical protein
MKTRSSKRKAPDNEVSSRSPAAAEENETADESPIRKHMRKAWENLQQEEAFKDLLTLRGANGGKLLFKDMKTLVENYKKKGYTAVTRDNLYYCLRLYKRAKSGPLGSCSITIGRQSTMSDITDDETSNGCSSNDVITSTGNDTDCSTNTSVVQMKRGGCLKGATKQAVNK